MIPKMWENLPGWDRHHYYARGSWNDFEPTPMIMDADKPGTFKCRVQFDGNPTHYNTAQQCYEYQFQVNVDAIPSLAYYPSSDEENGSAALVGKYVVLGPIKEDDEASTGATLSDRKWTIRSRQAGAVFEISFHPNAQDRR